jgi:hypothetical protein
MKERFIKEIASTLHIRKGNSESETEWRKRILYSAAGLNMLSAVYDYDDNAEIADGTVSMIHVWTRGEELLMAYNELYDLQTDVGKMAEDIRTLYIKTGYMLHRASRLTYPAAVCAAAGMTYVSRGQYPWREPHMSGLGTLSGAAEGTLIDVDDMFHLEKRDINEWYESFIHNIRWRKRDLPPSNVEYIKTVEDLAEGYWRRSPPITGISLCRDKREGRRQYDLLSFSGDTIESCVLPSWQVDNGEYFRIALALRVKAGSVPMLTIRNDGAISELRSGYLLPPSEQNFFELLTWPMEQDSSGKFSRWARKGSSLLLPAFKKLFSRMGFRIREEG